MNGFLMIVSRREFSMTRFLGRSAYVEAVIDCTKEEVLYIEVDIDCTNEEVLYVEARLILIVPRRKFLFPIMRPILIVLRRKFL